MKPSTGLMTALNKMREISVKEDSIYHQYVPTITETTDIAKFGSVILDSNLTPVYNEFFSLLKRIAFFAIENKRFNNPLSFLEGDNLPLGYAGQNVHVNPAKGRDFNVNDFAGLLQKYEAEYMVEYLNLNMDRQYPVTVTRAKVKTAFTSWADLEAFVNGIINSLYNGANIDEYNYTKALVTSAYYGGRIQTLTIADPTNEASDKAFVKELRKLYRKFQIPSSEYNAWRNMNGDEAKAVTTWSDASDIGVMITADIEAEIDVEVLASAFNMSKTDFLGRMIVVDNFDIYNDDGTLNKSGEAIKAVIFDRSFFKIKTQDREMDEFYNANNRTWQYYLNVVKMYNTSLFANAVALVTEAPQIEAQELSYGGITAITVPQGGSEGLDLIVKPINSTSEIAYATSNEGVFTVAKDPSNAKHCTVTAVGAGTATLTVTSGKAVLNLTVTVD